MINAGILGINAETEKYLDPLREMGTFRLVGLHDTDDESVLKLREKFGVKIFDHPDELLEKADALITTPQFNTFNHLKSVLRLSKHVFIDPPIKYNSKENKELINLSEEAEVIVQVGYRHRYNPAFMAARPFISRKVKMIQTSRMLPYNKKSCIHPVNDLLLLDIDNILSVINSRVKKISAYATSSEKSTPDVVFAIIEFHNGCTANLTAGTISTEEIQKAVFYNPDNFVEIDYRRQKANICYKDFSPQKSLFEEESDDLTREQIPVKNANEIEDELLAFSRSILNMDAPDVNLENTSQTMAIVREINNQIKLTSNC